MSEQRDDEKQLEGNNPPKLAMESLRGSNGHIQVGGEGLGDYPLKGDIVETLRKLGR